MRAFSDVSTTAAVFSELSSSVVKMSLKIASKYCGSFMINLNRYISFQPMRLFKKHKIDLLTLCHHVALHVSNDVTRC